MTASHTAPGNGRPRAGGTPSVDTFDCPQLAAPAGHYSHIATHRGVAHISGQLPMAPDGIPLAGEPFEVQTRQVLSNLDACLATAATSRDKLIAVTVYVTDISDWPIFDRVYRDWIGTNRPARAVAGAKELHYGSAVEVHAIAALD